MEKHEAKIKERTNNYYAPKFAEYFTVEFMTYIPIHGALMRDLVDPSISRVSNAFVEICNKVLNHDVLEHQTRNPIGSTIMKLKDISQSLTEEANLAIGACDARLPRSGEIPCIFKVCEKSPFAGFVPQSGTTDRCSHEINDKSSEKNIIFRQRIQSICEGYMETWQRRH